MYTGLGTISIHNYKPIYVYTHRHARLAEKYDLLSGPPMRALGTLLSHQSLSLVSIIEIGGRTEQCAGCATVYADFR